MTTGLLNSTALTIAPNFELLNHQNVAHNLSQVMGINGTLLVFVGDIWDLGCIRTTLWLQRQSYKLSLHGINAAIIVPNYTYDLNSFFMSIPREMSFQILADPDSSTYADYGITEAGFVMIDNTYQVRGKWEVKQGNVPHMRDIFEAIE